MKAILISIKPQWVELILNGIKKDEIRKGTAIGKAINKLIEEQGVAPMLIYCTKQSPWIFWDANIAKWNNGQGCMHGYKSLRNDNGKVVARFNATVDFLELKMIEGGLYFTTPDRDCFTPNLDLNENAQIDNFELLRYTGDKLGTQISDIHINDLEIFDRPKEIGEFYSHFTQKRYERLFSNTNIEIDTKTNGLRQPTKGGYEYVYPLTRAPQSWCYCEVEK